MSLLVIGYGNPLRRDDGIGWVLAQCLEDTGTDLAIEVVVAHQLLPEMAEQVSQANSVILIDATYGEEAGQWSCFPLETGESSGGLPSLIHKLSPAQLLALAQALYGCVPEARMITVTGSDFGYGEGISQEVEALIPEIQDYILSIYR